MEIGIGIGLTFVSGESMPRNAIFINGYPVVINGNYIVIGG